MSEIWTPQSIQVYQSWVDALNENIDELTKWEEDFVDSIAERLQRKVNLTERQAEVLERIYSEKTK